MKLLLSSHLLLLLAVLSPPSVVEGRCSKDKNVKMYRFCTYGNHDDGENGEHILHLQEQNLAYQPKDFKEDACHTVNYDSRTIGYNEKLVVGTTEHDSDPGEHNQNYKTELLNHEWHDNTCGTYSVSVSMDFGDHTRINACWLPISGNPPDDLTIDRCPPWYEARVDDSFTFFLEISPAGGSHQGQTGSGSGSRPPPGSGGTTQDYPSDWTDADGYSCDWYAVRAAERCDEWGDSYRNDGYVANEACVACGGGASESRPSPGSGGGAPEPRPSPGSGGTTTQDYPPGWTDAKGYSCDWYAEEATERCQKWGHSYRNDGYVANQACVACGGGGGDASVWKENYPENWVTSYGFGCDWFEENPDLNCQNYGHKYRHDGYVANDACVVCGGGRWA
eukprot:CAMPEP_0197178288 /NCGR_PEP_ID=MMETSP1423-20130617/3615_1 /TAXON_ID=476441 /ORGANISM="Pseudo-nitzschia heimii, Strain UNC1101" /LENGTH=391 /DNA_ID=CAMNT_0042627997 /DNA_START=58 /DNA_END=1233 /DNA_ORIENTATION=-